MIRRLEQTHNDLERYTCRSIHTSDDQSSAASYWSPRSCWSTPVCIDSSQGFIPNKFLGFKGGYRQSQTAGKLLCNATGLCT